MAFAKFVSHAKECKSEKDVKVRMAFVQICLQLEAHAKVHIEETPRRVDTGRLRASISSAQEGDGNTAYVGTNVEYAPYVHEGTVNMAPNPFLRNAVSQHIDEYRQILEDELKS